MISEKMIGYVQNSSAIRAMFEEGKRLAGIQGPENVYDFSLGNQNVAAPEGVNMAIIVIINEENQTAVHAYMNNFGYEDVRQAIAQSIK